MHDRGAHVGIFFLAGKEGGGEFTNEDEEVLVLFASRASAIADARTHRDEQRARADLEASSKRLRWASRPSMPGPANPCRSTAWRGGSRAPRKRTPGFGAQPRPISVAEVAAAREHHRQPMLVGGGDNLLVAA